MEETPAVAVAIVNFASARLRAGPKRVLRGNARGHFGDSQKIYLEL